MKLKFGIMLFFAIISGLHSQDSLKYNKFSYDKLALGISPSSIFNNIGAIQFSIDAGLTKRLRLSSEVGYIYDSAFGVSASGYRIRPSLEFLIYNGHDSGIQLGAFALIRNFNENRKARVNHPEGYYEYAYYKRSKDLLGGGVAFSSVTQLADKIKLEVGFGLGSGKLIIEDDKELDATDFDWFMLYYNVSGDYSFPIFYFNCNFSYTIFK